LALALAFLVTWKRNLFGCKCSELLGIYVPSNEICTDARMSIGETARAA